MGKMIGLQVLLGRGQCIHQNDALTQSRYGKKILGLVPSERHSTFLKNGTNLL